MDLGSQPRRIHYSRVDGTYLRSRSRALHDGSTVLIRKASAAYRAYRAEKFKEIEKFQIEYVFRKIRDVIFPVRHEKNERPVTKIRFLGLWDTVAAYGLPVDEMTRGISRSSSRWSCPTAGSTRRFAAHAMRCRSTTSGRHFIRCSGTRATSPRPVPTTPARR